MTAKTRLPTAVVAGGEINGLGVARSLARGGIPIVILDTDLSRPTLRTRHGRKRQVASLEGEAFLDALLGLRQEFHDKPVLFLTQERSVATVADHFDRIAEHYRISMPSATVMQTLMDKGKFQEVAEQTGLPIPRAIVLRGDRDLSEGLALRYPCILKPIIKSIEYDSRFKKAYRVASAEEVKTLHREIKGFAVMIVQEWIEGGDDAIYFCLQFRSRDRGAIASFTGRKLRSWPPRVGGTASCIPAPDEAPILERLTSQFFSRVGFFGMGSMEYKKDASTGRFLAVEPTVGRTDFQEEVATLNGVNIPLAAYSYEIGAPVKPPIRPRHPGAWVVSQLDRWSAETQKMIASFPSGVQRYDAVGRWNDPLPWICTTVERLEERFLKARRRLS